MWDGLLVFRHIFFFVAHATVVHQRQRRQELSPNRKSSRLVGRTKICLMSHTSCATSRPRTSEQFKNNTLVVQIGCARLHRGNITKTKFHFICFFFVFLWITTRNKRTRRNLKHKRPPSSSDLQHTSFWVIFVVCPAQRTTLIHTNPNLL